MSESFKNKGPVFDGRAASASHAYAIAAGGVAARVTVDAVKGLLSGSLKHPTGYYESQVTSDRSSSEVNVVSDSGVVYGPWLEGVSSMNARSRFKGYAAFRKTAQALNHSSVIESAIKQVLPRYEGGME